MLAIHPEGVDFHTANDIWGKETYETEDIAIERYSRSDRDFREPRAVIIGPVGENRVSFSVIENDYWRSAGRTGVGAVMGSKKLKALVFQGNRKRQLVDDRAIKKCQKSRP